MNPSLSSLPTLFLCPKPRKIIGWSNDITWLCSWPITNNHVPSYFLITQYKTVNHTFSINNNVHETPRNVAPVPRPTNNNTHETAPGAAPPPVPTNNFSKSPTSSPLDSPNLMNRSLKWFTAGLVSAWYASNIGVLLLNKYLLSNYGFKYPIFLTLCHMIACSLLSYAAIVWMKLVPLQIVKSRVQLLKIATLSLVFCASVVGGNVALRYLPVSFTQAVGATAPFFTAVFAYFLAAKREAWLTYATLIPVIAGVVMSLPVGEEEETNSPPFLPSLMVRVNNGYNGKRREKCPAYTFTSPVVEVLARHPSLTLLCLHGVGTIIGLQHENHPFYMGFYLFGFIMCLGATAARALKSVLQGILLSSEGEKLNSMNLVLYMAPIAVLFLVPATFLMEENMVGITIALARDDVKIIFYLLFNSALAYCVNFTNFLVTKHTSPLTLQVLGNVKGAVAVVISILMFKNPISATGVMGYLLTIIGVVLYSTAKKRSK
ncbi:unnamed protein product [Camellia sinensis]